MEVLNNNLDGFTQSVSFKFAWEMINPQYSKELSKIKATAKIPGFRKGKVSRKVIEQRYGRSVLADLQSNAIQESWTHLLNDLAIVPLSQPELDMTKALKRGSDLELTFSFEVIPPFDLPEASILEGEKQVWTVSSERINKEIENLCNLQGEWIDLKRRKKCRDGDLVTVSLNAFEGDEALEDLNSPEEKVELGQQRIIPEIEKAILGLKLTETFSAQYEFPNDHPNPEISGKSIRFEGVVNNIQEKSPLEMEALIEKLPDENEEALRDRLNSEIKAQKEQESLTNLRTSVAKQLKEKSDFALPPAAVEDQTNARLNQGQATGDAEHSDEDKQEAEAQAKSDLRFEAIVRAYAKANQIEVSDSDFTGRLLEMLRSAGEYGMQMIQFYQQPANRDRLKAMILDDKVIDSYIEAADFKEIENELGLEDEA
ncbi:MAG: trigger factor [Myxococcales bacterium]|nr:trigger factor [Myxococcales bacterium]